MTKKARYVLRELIQSYQKWTRYSKLSFIIWPCIAHVSHEVFLRVSETVKFGVNALFLARRVYIS